MTVPDVQAGQIERRLDTSHLPGIRYHRVFAACLPRLRRNRSACQLDWCDNLVVECTQRLPIDHLEHNLMQMNRVCVGGEIEDLPHFCRANGWVLGDTLHPHFWL